MRGWVCVIAGTGLLLAASSASAQRYDPGYPFCAEVADENGSRMECFYMSMEQCTEGAKGMPATCFKNPFFKPSAAPAVEAAPEPVPMPAPTLAKKKKKS